MTTRQLLDQFAEVAGAKRVATVKRALVGSNATEAYVSAAETERVHLLAIQVTRGSIKWCTLLSVGKTSLHRNISGKLLWARFVWDKRQAVTSILPVSKLNMELDDTLSGRQACPVAYSHLLNGMQGTSD